MADDNTYKLIPLVLLVCMGIVALQYRLIPTNASELNTTFGRSGVPDMKEANEALSTSPPTSFPTIDSNSHATATSNSVADEEEGEYVLWFVREKDGEVQILLQTDEEGQETLFSNTYPLSRSPTKAVQSAIESEFRIPPYEMEFIKRVLKGAPPQLDTPVKADLSAFVAMMPSAASLARLRGHAGAAYDIPEEHGHFVALTELVSGVEQAPERYSELITRDLGIVRAFLYPFVVTSLGAEAGQRQCGKNAGADAGYTEIKYPLRREEIASIV